MDPKPCSQDAEIYEVVSRKEFVHGVDVHLPWLRLALAGLRKVGGDKSEQTEGKWHCLPEGWSRGLGAGLGDTHSPEATATAAAFQLQEKNVGHPGAGLS